MIQENPQTRSGRLTMIVTVTGVVLFSLVVLSVTGVLTGEGAPRRLPPAEMQAGEGRHWYRLEVSLLQSGIADIAAAPFMVAIDPDGRGFVVNGREEWPAVTTSSATSLTVQFPLLETRISTASDAAGALTGTLETFAADGRRLSLPVRGAALPDGLPERRFESPQRPEARVEGADFRHVWRLELGPQKQLAKAVFSVSDSGETFGTIQTPQRDLGGLAGRQFGRILLLSTFDGVAVRAVVATLDESLEQLSGSITAAGESPTEFTGVRADRVAIAPPTVTVGPSTEGPRLDVYLVPHHRPSLEAAALAASLRTAYGIPVRGLALGRRPVASPAGFPVPLTAIEGGIGQPTGELVSLQSLPTFVIRGIGGELLAAIAGYPSRTAGGAAVATEVELVVARAMRSGR